MYFVKVEIRNTGRSRTAKYGIQPSLWFHLTVMRQLSALLRPHRKHMHGPQRLRKSQSSRDSTCCHLHCKRRHAVHYLRPLCQRNLTTHQAARRAQCRSSARGRWHRRRRLLPPPRLSARLGEHANGKEGVGRMIVVGLASVDVMSCCYESTVAYERSSQRYAVV